MRILTVASEAIGLYKTGGLADVITALSKGLAQKGHQVDLVLPLHAEMQKPEGSLVERIVNVDSDTHKVQVKIWKYHWYPSLRIYFIEQNEFITKEIKDYVEESTKYAIFNAAIYAGLEQSIWKPEIVHIHDWHGGLIPMLSKSLKQDYTFITTIHNARYQGILPPEVITWLPLPTIPDSVSHDLQDGNLDSLLQAIIHSDVITTVSKTYAQEIQTGYYGHGLEHVLGEKKVVGILNGLDYEIWNPASDKYLWQRYDQKTVLAGKLENKRQLVQDKGWAEDKLLMGFIGRLDAGQKGLDLLESAVHQGLLNFGNLVVLGKGDPIWEQRLQDLANQMTGMSVEIKYDEELAHKIYASCDIMLIPSIYEPCGLVQMMAMAYGSLPVGRRTGGLLETIEDGKNGWLFSNYESRELLDIVRKAANLRMNNLSEWSKMINAAMSRKFLWEEQIPNYEKMYQDALSSNKHIVD